VLGSRIRDLRLERGLTLRDLSASTGLSTGLLSQVERGLTDPSLAALRRIARALDVPLFGLFQGEDAGGVAVVRRERRMLVRSPGGGTTYARVSPGSGRLELLEGRLDPGAASSDDPWSHPSEECVVVLSGSVVVEVDGIRHELGPGDSCYFDSRLPHRYVNEGSGPATFLLAVTPPSF
jgi:transcriptional regulator with XRE-family HTH domain